MHHESGLIRSLSRICVLVVAVLMSTRDADAQKIWVMDPLIKVFPEATPDKSDGGAATQPSSQPAVNSQQDSRPGSGVGVAEIACGEYASFQVVFRADEPVNRLRATIEPFARAKLLTSTEPVHVLTPRPPRFVGYVHVSRPIPKPPRDQLRKPPSKFPDPLLESEYVDVPAGQVQAVWITVPTLKDTLPGDYTANLKLTFDIGGVQHEAVRMLIARMRNVHMNRPRLWVTNWFGLHTLGTQKTPAADSPEYEKLLRAYSKNMADHFQNVALIPPIGLTKFTIGEGGKLNFDFALFDRWVNAFDEAGVNGRIEGGHFGGRIKDWLSQFVVQIRRVKDGQIVAESVDPSSPEADAFYSQFLPALDKHLVEKSWRDRYLQHLADEPVAENEKTYRAIAALVHRYAPKFKIIEACHTKNLTGAIDVWVPMLNFLHQDFAHYQERQKAGEEVWTYTCLAPQGEYANRFVEQPLIKTRLLHWINFRYGITGYLHWGYNWWTNDAFNNLTPDWDGGAQYLPAGDGWIVYPGKDGPLDSIRFEAMRDGIGDYELLCMLAERDPATAHRLAEGLILAFDKYNTGIEHFRKTRHELLERLSAK